MGEVSIQSAKRVANADRVTWVWLIVVQWSVLGLLANLWFGWRTLDNPWFPSPLPDEYVLAVLILAGIAFSIALGFAQNLLLARQQGVRRRWLWFYGMLFVAASWQWLEVAMEDYRIHAEAVADQAEFRASIVEIYGEHSTIGLVARRDLFNDLNSHVGVDIDQSLFLAMLLPLFVLVLVTLRPVNSRWKFSVKELLIGALFLTLAIVACRKYEILNWVQWPSYLRVVGVFLGVLGLWWGFVKLGGQIGTVFLSVIWLIIIAGFIFEMVSELSFPVHYLDIRNGLLLGFAVGQFFLTIGHGFSIWYWGKQDANDKTPIVSQRMNSVRSVAIALVAIVIVQMFVFGFVHSFDLTTLVVVKKNVWKSSRFVAEVLDFNRDKELRIYRTTKLIRRPILLTEAGIHEVIATEELVKSDRWLRLDKQLNACSPNGKWFHNYPVFDAKYLSGPHRTFEIDGSKIPTVVWTKYVTGFQSVYNAQVSNEVLGLLPPNSMIDFIKPIFIEPIDYSQLRRHLRNVVVDEAQELLGYPMICLMVVYDENSGLFVARQKPDQVAAILRARAPDWEPWFRLEEGHDGGTFLQPQTIEAVVRLNGKAPPNLKLFGLSTDDTGHLTGVRCLDGDITAIPENDRRAFFPELDWLAIDSRFFTRGGSGVDSYKLDKLTSMPLRTKLLVMESVPSWVSLDGFLRANMEDDCELAFYSTNGSVFQSDFAHDLCPRITTLIVRDSVDSRLSLFAKLESSPNIKRVFLLSDGNTQQDLSPFLTDQGRLDPNSLTANTISLTQDQLDLQNSLGRVPFEVFMIDWCWYITYEDLLDRIMAQ